MKISLVIPIYNEEETIPELYRRIILCLKKDFSTFDYEIIFVDDGSTDNSFTKLKNIHMKDKNAKVIQFSRNFGHHIALTAGLDTAKGDYIVMMDGDLQDQPEEIVKLYNKLKKGYDVVYAVRMNKQFSFIKKFFSNLFNSFIQTMIKEKIVINSTIFRIMTRQVHMHMKELRERNRYLVGVIGWIGFKHGAQPVKHGKRYKGETKYTFAKQIDLALDAIFSFSRYPLTLILKGGIFLIFISIVFLFHILIFFFNTRQIIVWECILSAIFFIGGIQVIILGIIGEYIGRNYIEGKQRPLYIIKKLFS